MYTSVERSAVKLSLQSVKNPYYYKERGISTRIIGLLKSYLQGETDVQGSLAVKVRVTLQSSKMYDISGLLN